MRPDLLLHNARVATCNPAAPHARAVGVWRDRICAVGEDHEVLPLAAPGTAVVDLGGRFVCPGFTDCHVHLSLWAEQAVGHWANLDGAASLAEVLERVRELASRTAPGGWLRGAGWDKNHWREGRFPTAADLDAVTGDLPAVLASHDGHSLWVNSAAMRRAGVDPTAADPPEGRVLRDARGRPEGIFQEAAAWDIWECLPEPSVAETADALRGAMQLTAALGVTGVHNCEGGLCLAALQTLRERGELALRVTAYPPAEDLASARELGLRSGFGDEWLRLGGLKAFLDGALGGQTAAMLQPYQGTDNRGLLMMERGELEELIEAATRQGLAVALHAIGDRAVRLALDAFEAVRTKLGSSAWPRHRIEHAQHLHPEDLPRPARLGVALSVQPVHMLADIATCERHLGPRGRWAFATRSLLDAGALLGFGSDAPVEVTDPLVGFRAALERRGRDGAPAEGWHPEERVSAREALQAYTLAAARLAGEEGLKGSLEVGKLADLVVLSGDILTLPVEELAGVQVLGTVLGGRPVYDPGGLLRP